MCYYQVDRSGEDVLKRLDKLFTKIFGKNVTKAEIFEAEAEGGNMSEA